MREPTLDLVRFVNNNRSQDVDTFWETVTEEPRNNFRSSEATSSVCSVYKTCRHSWHFIISTDVWSYQDLKDLQTESHGQYRINVGLYCHTINISLKLGPQKIQQEESLTDRTNALIWNKISTEDSETTLDSGLVSIGVRRPRITTLQWFAE